jgi:hypothetical protein
MAERNNMTLYEAKEQLYKLLDEVRPAADLVNKLDRLFDMGQKEVALYVPIWREKTYAVGEVAALPKDCRQPVYLLADGKYTPCCAAWWNPDGLPVAALPETFTLRYKAVPTDIADGAAGETELEVPEEAALAVVLFVAAQCNSTEYDQRFFQSFYSQYQGKLSNLAAQETQPVAAVVGGYGV